MTVRPSNRVGVLINYPLEEKSLNRLRALSRQLAITYRPCEEKGQLLSLLPGIEVLFGYQVPIAPEQMPGLRWIQLTGSGYDHVHPRLLNGPITVTNAPVFAVPIAEQVFASLLSLCRGWPDIPVEFQQTRAWPHRPWVTHMARELRGQTLGIVGFGIVGREVARLGQSFGMPVISTRRKGRFATREPGVEILPATHLKTLLRGSDFVVVCVPLNPETEGLLGESELRAMKREACLVNVSRGKVVDEAALTRALKEGWIRAAALDVFVEEPLSPESPLFDLRNALLTPHVAGISTGYQGRITDLFCENLQRYLRREPLLNVVRAEAAWTEREL